MNKNKTRLVGLVAATTFTLASAGFGATATAQMTTAETPAAATPTGVKPTPDATTAGQIDPTKSVTLNIQKYLGDPEADNTGAPKNPDALTPLEGAEFKVEKVTDVDLTTQAGWEKANQYAELDQEGIAGLTVGDATTVTTNADGLATFTADNGAGLYRVTEQSRTGYTTAPAFLITLPYPGDNGAWSYERTVYPKNQNIVPSKQVDDTNATIGSDIKYTINAPVPAGELSHFAIEDKLIDNLALKGDSVQVTTSQEGLTLNSGDDYDLTTDNNTLRVEFTEDGRAKLQEARKSDPALQVNVEFLATINSLPTSGQLTNTATVELPNGATVTTDDKQDGEEDQPTSTTFGTLTITKTSSNPDGPLNGAEFQLFQCRQDDNQKWESLGEPLTVATTEQGDPKNVLTTSGGDDQGSDATAMGYGVPISSFAAVTGQTDYQYCVLETTAPDGYVRNPELQPVEIDTAARTLAVSVDNQKNSIIGQLPATGAWGIVLVFLVGLALLARGLYTSFKDSRSAA